MTTATSTATTVAATATATASHLAGFARSLSLAGGVGAALSAGVFFAFSTFVMRALGRLPGRQGLTAMQAINEAAPNGWLMGLLFGTAALCVASIASTLGHLGETGAGARLAGAALFLVAIALTAGYHVPHNDALARLDPDAPASLAAWARYLRDWTTWNHLRTGASAAGAIALLLGSRR